VSALPIAILGTGSSNERRSIARPRCRWRKEGRRGRLRSSNRRTAGLDLGSGPHVLHPPGYSYTL
jgi:hypothetical protein